MAKVILTGQNDLQLNRERAEEIKRDWKNDKFNKDDKIEIGMNSIKAGDIRSIRISKNSAERADMASLSTEELKKDLGDFEEKYENHRTKELKNYIGLRVMNVGIHDWLAEKGVINESDSHWSIDPELYRRFSKKEGMLSELNYRREYAEQKEEESLNQLIKHEEKGT